MGLPLTAIYPNPLVAWLTFLIGIVLGIGIALSEWRTKAGFGALFTGGASILASLTSDKLSAVKAFVASTTLLTPLLYCLNITIIVFLTVLIGGSMIVFGVNYVPARRRNEPEAAVKAWRAAFDAFCGGLHRHVMASPDLTARNRIRELETNATILSLINQLMAREVANPNRSERHFLDEVEATGRYLLRHLFGDDATLQHYRMALFARKGERLEYWVVVNNGDWTAHSQIGFNLASSFAGEAITRDRPLIYPRDKKFRTKFTKRKYARYKSFIAIPVPCRVQAQPAIGVLTVDYTGTDKVFTEARIEALFAFSQLIHALYLLNCRGGNHD